ncbi:ZmpA/ZmpB/ZmpC family metallo-endopeptidase-related protein, partial [[Clostridium] innocuum]|uniref:ZmpA/ZmpB/ZmpC family metallo-endopeptidase-related protein n=1 Tax=Clostridium innocuum TaxID=1522 RepID=UPI001C7013C1
KEEPKKEEQPQEVKEIHITNEQGLKDIAKAPDKTYILDSDIAVTSDSILIEKEFTGTLEGNGHVIKGLKQPLFTSLKKANINDVNLSSIIDTDADTAALALRAADTKINGVGILAVIHSKQTAAGMLVNNTNTSIENSYVSGEITGEAGASGFVVSGNAEISNSYVTGVIEGKQSAYGFGKESSITNCYAAVYVEGKETGNFNEESSKLESCFYDISVASKEEPRAQEYTSAQLISGDLAIDGFQQTKGSYPSSKKEITDKYSEEAKKLSALSTLAVSTQTSLMGLTKDVALPSSTGKETVSWSAKGNVGINGNTLLAKVSTDPTKDTDGELIAATKSG